MGSEIFIIIPVYNEAAVIAQTLHEVMKTGHKIIVVDDGSSDGTGAIVKTFPVYYLRHHVNIGQGAALQTGMDFAKRHDAAAVVHFDADGQHRASDIGKLLKLVLEDGYDVVFGSRFLQHQPVNMPFTRRIFLKLARYVNWLFTGILLTDAHNGLRALSYQAIYLIRFSENRMAHASEILSQIRDYELRYCEVPVTIDYTAYSRNKGQSLWNSINIIFDLLFKKINR
ncbi:MAG TPA: glycosyltransferase family 2 protein [Chitinophagaceae bacterium]|nr:glycosyltransferase family 2 protein [Chitinophagaceae bacterium]